MTNLSRQRDLRRHTDFPILACLIPSQYLGYKYWIYLLLFRNPKRVLPQALKQVVNRSSFFLNLQNGHVSCMPWSHISPTLSPPCFFGKISPSNMIDKERDLYHKSFANQQKLWKYTRLVLVDRSQHFSVHCSCTDLVISSISKKNLIFERWDSEPSNMKQPILFSISLV